MNQVPNILLLSKTTEWSEYAIGLANALFSDRLQVATGEVGDSLPNLDCDRYALIVSFLSPWIVPVWLLDRADNAINFHPGTRDYPGIGCYNFALYENAIEYGAICHHMEAKVDTGRIIAERRFKVSPYDTVESLKLRTMVTMIAVFHEIISDIALGRPLPTSRFDWTRKPFTRRELEHLRTISPDMSSDEIKRRVRAVTYPGFPGAKLQIGGFSFETEMPRRRPLA
jgi:methionyl-tRNA formyltransferase